MCHNKVHKKSKRGCTEIFYTSANELNTPLDVVNHVVKDHWELL